MANPRHGVKDKVVSCTVWELVCSAMLRFLAFEPVPAPPCRARPARLPSDKRPEIRVYVGRGVAAGPSRAPSRGPCQTQFTPIETGNPENREDENQN